MDQKPKNLEMNQTHMETSTLRKFWSFGPERLCPGNPAQPPGRGWVPLRASSHSGKAGAKSVWYFSLHEFPSVRRRWRHHSHAIGPQGHRHLKLAIIYPVLSSRNQYFLHLFVWRKSYFALFNHPLCKKGRKCLKEFNIIVFFFHWGRTGLLHYCTQN